MKLLKRDLISSLEHFIDQTEAYRRPWILRNIQVEAWPRHSFRLPSWQAHRGYWREGAPQNTMESLIAAREKGAEMCEFDVRLTKDRVPVLFHDPGGESLGEDSPGPWWVNQLTYEELKARVADRVNVCRLRDVLTSRDVTPYLNIELKSEEIWDDPLERYVAEEVRRAKAQDRVLFSSFNPVSIWKISRLLPQVPRAFLASPEMAQRSLREMWWAPFLKIQLLHLDKVMVDEVSMRFWNRHQVPVAVWTATDSAEMMRFWNLGAVSVISDCLPPPSAPAREHR